MEIDWFVTIVSVSEATWVALVTVYLILERRTPQGTLAWIFVLSFLPAIGIVAYLFFGPRRFERRKRRRARARQAVKGAMTFEGAATHDIHDHVKHLTEMCEASVGLSARARHADVRVYCHGAAMYDALEEAIRGAKHHVHLEYYIWEPDQTGTRFRDALIERARAGVEVRVLIDSFGSSNAGRRFWKPLKDAGGRVVRFNALTLNRWKPRMANFRTHRKIAIVDGRIGFTGGMNVSDVHTAKVSGKEAWRDTHLRLEGYAVKGLQMVFFEDWHYATDETPGRDGYILSHATDAAGSTMVQVVSSGPDENLDAIHKLYFSAITGAHFRVLLSSPYFVPDDAILTALTTASLRGVDVRVLVPETGDIPLVAAAAWSYFPELLQAGVRIYEFGPPVLHAKSLVVDDDIAIVGTANCDNRSFRLNFEVVVSAYDAKLVESLTRAFDEDLVHAREVTLESVQTAPFHRRLFSSAARLFSPIL